MGLTSNTILKQKNAIAALSKSEIEQSYKITNENYKIILSASRYLIVKLNYYKIFFNRC